MKSFRPHFRLRPHENLFTYLTMAGSLPGMSGEPPLGGRQSVGDHGAIRDARRGRAGDGRSRPGARAPPRAGHRARDRLRTPALRDRPRRGDLPRLRQRGHPRARPGPASRRARCQRRAGRRDRPGRADPVAAGARRRSSRSSRTSARPAGVSPGRRGVEGWRWAAETRGRTVRGSPEGTLQLRGEAPRAGSPGAEDQPERDRAPEREAGDHQDQHGERVGAAAGVLAGVAGAMEEGAPEPRPGVPSASA